MSIINGTPGNDTLTGTGGGVVDTISGGAGNDFIRSVNALPGDAAWDADAAAAGLGDVLSGGDGNDTIAGSAGSVIDGGAGDDVLDGLAGSRLTGGAGNDNIGGDVAVYAGNRADYSVTPTLTYIGQGLWAQVFEVKDLRAGSPDGTDIVSANSIQFADGLYVPPPAPDTDALFLSTSHEEVFTLETAADVAVPGTATPVLDAHALLAFGVTPASFAIAGGTDAAAFTIDPVTGQLSFVSPPDFEAPTDAASITQGDGLQPVVARDNIYEVVLRVIDANGNEDLVGVLVHVDDLSGEFDAIADGEVLAGSLENDSFDDMGFLNVSMLGLDGDDNFITHSSATVDGGVGFDTVELALTAVSNLVLVQVGTTTTVSDGSVLSNIEAIVYTGSLGNDVMNAAGAQTITLELNGGEGNDQLTGGSAADVLIGGDGSDVLTGGAGNDTLYASLIPSPDAPNVPVLGEIDKLEGGAGDDVIVGNGGATTVVYSGLRANYSVTADPLTGVVTVADLVGLDGTDTVSAFSELAFLDISLDANLNPIKVGNSAPVMASSGGGATAALTVLENQTAVTTVQAVDADGNPLTYSIVGGADAARFQINASTGVLAFVTAPNAELPTDAGANGVYDVVVQASDGSLTDTQALAVTVGDVNEFAVTKAVDVDFAANAVASGAAAGTLVGITAKATDADSATNTVRYAITTANSPFVIDAATGVVSVKAGAVINYTAVASYTLAVQATSADGSVSTQNFTVAVNRPGNVAPVIDSNGAGAAAAVTVNENTLAVTTVHATDALFTAIRYSIVGGADAALFKMGASGALSFVTAPNAELPKDAGANNVYDVVVQASDGMLTDTQALAVTVADVNEFAVATAVDADAGLNHVQTGAAAGTLVGITARATDADASRNAVTYALAGFSATSAFKIDAATGVVSVNNPAAINIATAASQVISVIATSADGSKSTTAFTVAIDKPAAAAPVIDSNGAGASAAVTINENALLVATVHATDINADLLSYSIAGGADAARFSINSSTGVLSFIAGPNAEAPTDAGANGVYDVVVKASDGMFTDTQALAITVADVNEFAVTAPADANAGVNRVAHAAPVGTLVGITAKATDADASVNVVSYALLGASATSAFKIDAVTGVVSVNNPAAINYATAASQTITVVATSSDGSTASTAFTVAVDKPPKAAPVLDSNGGGATAAVSVQENTLAVTTVHATDANLDVLRYSLAGGADAALFTINATTGALRFVAAPNAEAPRDAGANNVYDVVVQASDGTLTDTQALAVSVADVNEFMVTLPTDTNTAANTVAESAAAGTKVGITAKAVDADATNNAVTYSLAMNAGGLFAIDAQTGVITTTGGLNFEAASYHALQVAATSADGGVTYGIFTVNVTDVNEAPVISSLGGGATGTVSVLANTTSVLTVAATDPDAGAVLKYSISGGADAASFVIDSATGALRFAGAAGPYFGTPTDVGGNNVYDVQVKVCDASGASDTQDLAVQVTQPVGLVKSANFFLLNSLSGSNGNDVLSTNGALDYLYGLAGNDTLSAGSGTDWLDGGTGNDTVTFATARTAVVADLSTGRGTAGDALGDTYVSIENLVGSNFNDTLIGNALANLLNGGAGNDLLVGNGGGDLLVGGGGNDTFDFNALADSAPAAMTRILDFMVGGDRIDLSGLDANTALAGNQAFKFVGQAAFTGAAGELRYEVAQGHTYVYADVNGDKTADFAVDLFGVRQLTQTDFSL